MCVRVFTPDFVPMPIYFTTLNAHYRQEDIDRPGGIRKSDELMFVLDGEGVLRCGGNSFLLRKGSAFYLKAGVGHAYYSDGELVTAWITFRGSVQEHLETVSSGREFVYYEDVDVLKYSAQIEQIRQEYYGKRREELLSAMTYSLVMEFFGEEKRRPVSAMEQVLIYMEENYHQKITLEQLAERSHSSKSTFCKEFRRVYGCTAFEKLMEIRLYMAKHMLRTHPVDKIGVIAARCGFEDAAYFCKAFRARYGCSPGAFREAGK